MAPEYATVLGPLIGALIGALVQAYVSDRTTGQRLVRLETQMELVLKRLGGEKND